MVWDCINHDQISRSPHDCPSLWFDINNQPEKPKRPSFHTGKWWYPWNRYPSCWTPQGAFQKGDIPNKYPLYYKVYMGLIIRGNIPRGPHHLPYDHLTSTLNDPFWIRPSSPHRRNPPRQKQSIQRGKVDAPFCTWKFKGSNTFCLKTKHQSCKKSIPPGM